MFGNWISYGSKDEDADKAPPPPATPVDFPHYVPSSHFNQYTENTVKVFYDQFAAIQKPADVSGKHVDSLNLRVSHDQPLEEIVPHQSLDETSYLPDMQWEDSVSGGPPSSTQPLTKATLCNGREAPGHDIFLSRSAELSLKNDQAYRAVQRLPPRSGTSPVKLGYLFKFWQGLFLMSQYWDTSLDDEYEDVHEDSKDGSEATGSAQRNSRRYKGRRTGTGRDMPDSFREDTVRALVEAVTWVFGCQVSPPRLPPRLTMRSSFFSVRLSYFVFRISTDRQRARQGLVEGPLMGLQSRSETSFRPQGEAMGTGQAEALDLLREVAALLLLAQERAREGKSEKKPGEGKWYTSTPRWGGGAGGEVGNLTGNNSDDDAAAKKDEKRAESKPKSRRASAAEAYRKLLPGMGTWDPKITYVAIGKDDDREVDDVFLISSINHHVSILRLRVHPAYISFLETGKPPPAESIGSTSSDLPWYVLELRRSKWYDLFSVEDRVEAMRGIWGVTAWLMRGKLVEEKEKKGEGVGQLDEDVVMSD